ncbi:MAG: ABC transporter permease, partial [Alphaproteobacteria bacterium]|nr:ABC transporter permease [Alphaproteobacteria bacterium]
MFVVLRDLLRYNGEFLAGILMTGVVVAMALLSFVSPYPPLDQFVAPMDVPPSAAH